LISKLTLLVAALACAALVVAGPAGAGTVGSTVVTIKEENGDFQGRVKSNVSECIENRKVVVFKKRDGQDLKIASDTTEGPKPRQKGLNFVAQWSTGNTHVGKGKYYAKARQVQFAKRGVTGCDADKSRIVTVD
jgi:hypothetical protein